MSVLDYIERIKQENEGPRITAQKPRNMYSEGQLVQNTVDGSRPGYQGPGGGKPGRSIKIIDKESLKTIVNKANLSDKWHSEEDIAKLYAEATGDTNVTKRKVKDKTVTYKKLDSPTIKNAGGLISKEQKIERVFNDLLAMDGPVPEVDLGKYKNRNISNYKKYIMSKTGLGTNFVDQTVNNLPTFKKHEKAFKYLWTSGLAKTDLANMSLTGQLNWAIDAGKGKPVFTGVSKLNIEDPTFTLMRIAKENWNKNKGAGNIQLYDKNGKKITWKHGLKMNINNVSFSKDKSKKRFTLGNKKGTINVRLEGEKYFPEVFENQRYINELKSTLVDNPFKPGKQIEFGKLMRKVYMQGHGWKPHAPLFSIFHGPEGIAKEPFKNLSFGMQDLNRALYHMDNIPLKGLKQKVINQALIGLKGKKGQKLLEAIVAKHSDHASQVAAGKKFDRPLRIQVLEEVAQTGDLGSKETKVVANILKQAGFNIDKCLSSGGRVSLKFGKGVNTCITGVIEAEQKKAMQGNKISKAKFGKFGKYARTAGWFLGAWDVPIELAFALPHMLQGDKEAAKRATTAGLLGWGEKKLDEVKADSPEAYKYAKHVKDNNDWVDAWFITQDKTEELETLKEGTGAQENALSQLNKANAKMEKIQEEYVGYVDEEGNFDPMAGAEGKIALQDYLREDVKKKSDLGLTITDIPLLGDYNMAPYKGGDPITNVKQYIEQKGEPYWKSGLEHAAEEAGVADLYDTFMQGADIKDPRDLYSELPLEYASELAALEKQEMLEGLRRKGLYGTVGFKKMLEEQGMDYDELSNFAGGGMVGIRKPSAIAPTGGPMSQGLRSLYNNVRKR